MSGIIEILLKVAPLITVAFVLIRFNITTTNKTVIDILLTPKNTSDWEDFLEIISVSLILVLTLNIPSLIFDSAEFSKFIQDLFILTNLGSFLLTGIVLLACWIISLFGVSIKKRLINIIIFTNFALILIFSFLNTVLNKAYILQLFNTKQNSKLLVAVGIVYIFYIFLFYIYRFLYRLFNGPRIPAYKIEKTPVNLVEEELKDLYFIYMFDGERHIMANYPVSRKSVTFPAYVYYPKENSLVKYTKD
ncbi:hypothetical protein P5G65_04670 [Paenibacillus chondroitinus]|uniref:DUF5671 domain-containing protein n=1 Tax=Paenibacillus chondroitinus TaxID=59842 RepID=A0ABU6D631_9BACL|nr:MULTISPECIES: hypothetical protein [Paenibacillus]MCY9658159.1 hypothetical protein [Paenibacillus anseongense]MEB4793178.1 hypothetical protein [Paenibacillus chondroitinus]